MIKENDSIQLNTNDRVDLGLLIDGLITTTHLVDRLNTQLTDVERHYSLARGPVKQEGDQKKGQTAACNRRRCGRREEKSCRT